MVIHRVVTEIRLRQLRRLYRRLPDRASESLADIASQMAQGRRPPRIWVFRSGPDPEAGHEGDR